jgi:peptidoglycan hydrolase-like protein with peptidoglycan-binding domain
LAHAGAAHGTQAPAAQRHKTQGHAAQAHGSAAHGTQARGTRKKGASKSRRPRGQQAIDSSRVIEIQEALIRVHYYSGEANGNWDDNTKAAMMKFQADQGWQTKLMPDARALKKLGLGPDYSNAINAKNSNFADPPPISSIPPTVSAGFADAAGVKQ